MLHRESIPYSQLEKILEFEFERHLKRPLSSTNLCFLRELILGKFTEQPFLLVLYLIQKIY